MEIYFESSRRAAACGPSRAHFAIQAAARRVPLDYPDRQGPASNATIATPSLQSGRRTLPPLARDRSTDRLLARHASSLRTAATPDVILGIGVLLEEVR